MDGSRKKVYLHTSSAVFACLLLICSAAPSASGVNRWLAGISYGISELDFHDPEATHIDNRGTYIKLLGEYGVNDGFAIEYGYLDYGTFSARYSNNDEKITIDGYALAASAVGKVAIVPKIRLTGKIGLDFWSEDVNVDFSFGNRSQHAGDHGSGISSHYGVGLEYVLAKDILIRLEAQKYKGIDFDVELATNRLGAIDLSDKDVNTIGATLLFAF